MSVATDFRVTGIPAAATRLRDSLRGDLRALQSPEWNEGNHDQVFPRIVAEIWKRHGERQIALATQQERVGRLEAEKALALTREETAARMFTPSEETEYRAAWEMLDLGLKISTDASTDDASSTYSVETSLAYLVAQCGERATLDWSTFYLRMGVAKEFLRTALRDQGIESWNAVKVHSIEWSDVSHKGKSVEGLLVLLRFVTPDQLAQSGPAGAVYYESILRRTTKLARFCLWARHIKPKSSVEGVTLEW